MLAVYSANARNELLQSIFAVLRLGSIASEEERRSGGKPLAISSFDSTGPRSEPLTSRTRNERVAVRITGRLAGRVVAANPHLSHIDVKLMLTTKV